MSAYLFVHFTGEDTERGEQIYFSVSKDGLHFKDLNNGQPVLTTDIGELGARDPFIVKNPITGEYFLIATDLRIYTGKGWDIAVHEGSRDILVFVSKDLICWSKVRSATIGIEKAGCVWAPEAVWDEAKKSFFVFFASMVDGKQRIYSTYTKDFKDFEDTKLYIERDNHVIDTTIIRAEGKYFRFSKDETVKNIIAEYSDSLTGEFKQINSKFLDELKGVEGPECYKLPDGRFALIVDRFATHKGYLPLITDSLKSGEFIEAADFDFGQSRKRHGGVIEISDEEYDNLIKSF